MSGTSGAATDVDEDPGRTQRLAADLPPLRRGEACVALIDGDHGIASQRRSTPRVEKPSTSSLRAFTFFMSTVMGPGTETP